MGVEPLLRITRADTRDVVRHAQSSALQFLDYGHCRKIGLDQNAVGPQRPGEQLAHRLGR